MTPEQAHGQAFLVLAKRLVDHHGLTTVEAFTAVGQRHRRETGPHTHLVTTEAATVLEEACAPIRAFAAALVPAAEAACAAVRELVEALQQQPNVPPGRRDRPAWATPYGPPPHRSR